MRGRKPIPTHLKLVTGNRGRRPVNEGEPKPALLMPSVPPHLSDVAKVEWGRVSNELFELGLLSRIDRSQLAAYCECYALWVEASQMVAKLGQVVKTPAKTITRKKRDGTVETETTGGYPMPNPFLAIRNKQLELMHKFAVEFGMTPSARSRVNVNPPDNEEDPAKKYLG